MDTLKFEFGGKHINVMWNQFRNCVDVSFSLTGLIFTIDENGVAPCFNWKDTTEEKKALGVFLESTNFYDFLKPKKENRRR